MADKPYDALSLNTSVAAVKGTTNAPGGFGLWGVCDTGHAVHGDSKTSQGVVGKSQTFNGVNGISVSGNGVHGESTGGHGIFGETKSNTGSGVIGINHNGGDGVSGFGRRGVVGISPDFQGVHGESTHNAGVAGISENFDGVFGVSHNPATAGISGHNLDHDGNPNKNGLAGFFRGNVRVTGDINLDGDMCFVNADCAEDFDVSDGTEAGEVVVLTNNGCLEPSAKAYDTKVVGVISGAGNYKPAILLDRQHENSTTRKPVAMMGKVYCKVDANTAPIEIGDMLTTSDVSGYAMKASDHSKAFGAVIGKALAPLTAGKGLIPILIALQ